MPKASGVGYKKPPKSGQFKKGKSGNPAGRPKGSKNFATELAEELSEKIAVKEDGKKKSISKQRALIKALLAKALQGQPQAAMALFTMISKTERPNDGETDEPVLTSADLKVLELYKQSVLQEAAKPKSGKGAK